MKSIKFGGKPSIREKAAAVQDRYGKTTGASKGAARPQTKVKPKVSRKNGGTIGVTVKKTF